MRSIARILLGLIAVCATGWAQSTAQINGAVRDASGLAVTGADVQATQTDTGQVRTANTGSDGSFVFANLPIGPYKLEVSKAGFSKYVQSGIVLQVDSNPTVAVALKVGAVSDQVTVQADAAMVETHSTGVGTVVDNQRVVELPLNGRNATELIYLSGMANVATGTSTSFNSPRNYPTVIVSVAGGTGNGINFLLDGVSHNDTQNSLNLPLPFPDALQEFKVETSAMAAQYGYHSNATVNAVTRSGSNQFHGDAFEFLRNGDFNARDFFAAARDTLKRNQFGGVIGGPVRKDKLFFFAGYQGTVQKSSPPSSISFIPTPAMLAGNFTAIAAPACNNGKQITLPASLGFTGNTIAPSLFNPVAQKITTLLPSTPDPCGKVTFGLLANQSEQFGVSRVDYLLSDRQTIFARLNVANLNVPTTYDGKSALTVNTVETQDRVYSFALGDTYLIGSGIVSAFRVGMNRTVILRPPDSFLSWAGLGAQNVTALAGETARLTVSGNGFAIGSGNSVPVIEHTGPNINIAEDFSLVKGSHQFGFGGSYLHTMQNYNSGLNAPGLMTVNGASSGIPLADFMLGLASAWTQGDADIYYFRQNYAGLYAQDSWKLNSRLTLNYGVRWEPYTAPSSKDNQLSHFDPTLFAQNVHSTVYPNAPAGLIFVGDTQYTVGDHPSNDKWNELLPRAGLVWDPRGDGRTTIRAAYGIFNDRQNLGSGFFAFSQNPPFGNLINLANVSLSAPWAAYPGGNPFPIALSKNVASPAFGTYRTDPFNYKPPSLNQWNLSLQRQIGLSWLFTANYIGNSTIHLISAQPVNPALFLGLGACTINGVNYPTCSTTANTNQRRLLFLQNPTQGQFYSTINVMDNGGTGSYNGLLLSAQKRLSRGVSVLANYTLSHCISDYFEAQVGTGTAISLPGNRRAFRSNCATGDQRQVANLSVVAQTPQFSNRALRLAASGWQVSPIVTIRSSQFFSVTTGGVDNALTGQPTETPNQLSANPYPTNQTVSNWINASAFGPSALGTYGNLGLNNLKGPGIFQFDMAVSRTFRLREKQTLQVRGEAFNLPNHFNPSTPVATTNSGAFGQIQSDISGTNGLTTGDPRIVQLALKLVF